MGSYPRKAPWVCSFICRNQVFQKLRAAMRRTGFRKLSMIRSSYCCFQKFANEQHQILENRVFVSAFTSSTQLARIPSAHRRCMTQWVANRLVTKLAKSWTPRKPYSRPPLRKSKQSHLLPSFPTTLLWIVNCWRSWSNFSTSFGVLSATSGTSDHFKTLFLAEWLPRPNQHLAEPHCYQTWIKAV